MRPQDFSPDAWGRLTPTNQRCWAFVPELQEPAVEWDSALIQALLEAERAVAELKGAARRLPNPHLLVRPFIRREAALSSRIEGTQASLSELLFYEADERARTGSDVFEVANYVLAFELGRELLEKLPWSLRVVRSLHERLLTGVRGGSTQPGAWRREQVWIGPEGCELDGARYVPPPPGETLQRLLSSWERSLHEQSSLPSLLSIATRHYQFEAIHPFRDGNGRVGRLLIALMFESLGLLNQPLLYLSAYFERERQRYYDCLLRVSTHGDWRGWFMFFLAGAREQAVDALERSERLLSLHRSYLDRYQTARTSAVLTRLVEQLFAHPVLTISATAAALGVSWPTANKHVNRLVEDGLLEQPMPERRWDRLFVAPEILRLLDADY